MITRKEFYFVRHGQTDHNILEGQNKKDHPDDTPLNDTGRNQARRIEPVISSLPVQTVCSSPLKRVQETKEIITPKLQVSHHVIVNLGECTAQTWREMVQLGMYAPLPSEGVVRHFIDRIRDGMSQALSLPGPSLIVAHGGVHWAICHLMNIEEHEWVIDNCVPVHFSLGDTGKWIAKKLI